MILMDHLNWLPPKPTTAGDEIFKLKPFHTILHINTYLCVCVCTVIFVCVWVLCSNSNSKPKCLYLIHARNTHKIADVTGIHFSNLTCMIECNYQSNTALHPCTQLWPAHLPQSWLIAPGHTCKWLQWKVGGMNETFRRFDKMIMVRAELGFAGWK